LRLAGLFTLFCPAGQTGPTAVRKQPERYAQCRLNWLENLLDIDILYIKVYCKMIGGKHYGRNKL
jgi:hypothetical protein